MIGSPYITQTDLKLEILLPQPSPPHIHTLMGNTWIPQIQAYFCFYGHAHTACSKEIPALSLCFGFSGDKWDIYLSCQTLRGIARAGGTAATERA
jgi:hypothetical protein